MPVSFAPTLNATASAASTAFAVVDPTRKKAAHATKDPTITSLRPVLIWRATTGSVTKSSPANTASRRPAPIRRASPNTASPLASPATSCTSGA